MRIVGGSFRGRTLAAPPGPRTRPTADRTREAVFNVLAHAPWSPGLADRRVLDLFAGSGALGLEAISRGAAFALFVETDEAARGAIRDNIDALGLFGATRVHRRDAASLGPRPGGLAEAFDLAFLDPPYRQGWPERVLPTLLQHGWLAEGAIVVVETAADEPPVAATGYEPLDRRSYGAAGVTFLHAHGNSAA